MVITEYLKCIRVTCYSGKQVLSSWVMDWVSFASHKKSPGIYKHIHTHGGGWIVY